MPQPLLTLAIPTYNRKGFLEACLDSVLPQVARAGERVELLISDNCSSDDTQALVERHLAAGAPIRYVRNTENIGADRNFAQCLSLASGTYFLLLGDDDLLLEGALDMLLPVLEEDAYGVVHLGSYPFKEDHRAEVPKRPRSGEVLRFADPVAFAEKVNIMITFISGNVVNKSLLPDAFSAEPYFSTNLVQVSWLMEALLRAKANAVIDRHLIAAKAENTGGYQLCRVFGVNLHAILAMFEGQGANPAIFDAVRRKTITTFLPEWILRVRRNQGTFAQESPVAMLKPAFHRFPAFWIMAMPAATWPLPLARPWLNACRKALKLAGKW